MTRDINELRQASGSLRRKPHSHAVNAALTPTPGGRGEKPGFWQWLVPHPHNCPGNHRAVQQKVLASIFWASVLLGPAFADDAAKPKVPDFVPFVVDQQQDQAARQDLNGLKFGDAAPIVAWLNELEARAKGQWEADNAPKKTEAKP